VFENKILKRIFGPDKRGSNRQDEENYTVRNFITCTL
jgi:hypothetical protein